MAPDLPYYLPMSAEGSHTLMGLIGVDLALALVAFVVWQAFVGAAVVAFAPSGMYRRLAGYPLGLRASLGTIKRFAVALVALLLGGVTHLAWDLFTHAHGWVYSHVAWLRAGHGPAPGYQWVHALSELVAVTAIAVSCRRWWRAHPPGTTADDRPRLAVRVAAFALVALTAALGAVHGTAEGAARGYTGEVAFFFTVTGAGSWGGLTVIVLAGAWRVFHSYRDSGRPNLTP
jgi:hypothetical protein